MLSEILILLTDQQKNSKGCQILIIAHSRGAGFQLLTVNVCKNLIQLNSTCYLVGWLILRIPRRFLGHIPHIPLLCGGVTQNCFDGQLSIDYNQQNQQRTMERCNYRR